MSLQKINENRYISNKMKTEIIYSRAKASFKMQHFQKLDFSNQNFTENKISSIKFLLYKNM